MSQPQTLALVLFVESQYVFIRPRLLECGVAEANLNYRATEGAPTQPSSYRQIFERGIDPDVDNPEKCHAHSEIPDAWPPSEEILSFQERVRDRARTIYEDGNAPKDAKICRALWLGFEHEGQSLEVLDIEQADRVVHSHASGNAALHARTKRENLASSRGCARL